MHTTGLCKSLGELGAITTLAALDLGKRRVQLQAVGMAERLDRGLLRLEAEAGTSLLLSAHAVVGDRNRLFVGHVHSYHILIRSFQVLGQRKGARTAGPVPVLLCSGPRIFGDSSRAHARALGLD